VSISSGHCWMKSDEAECADAQQAASATMVVRTLVGVHGRSYLRIETTVQCGAVTEIPKLLVSQTWLQVMDRGRPWQRPSSMHKPFSHLQSDMSVDPRPLEVDWRDNWHNWNWSCLACRSYRRTCIHQRWWWYRGTSS